MPVQNFAPDATGTSRIQLHWTTENEVVTVLYKNNPAGFLSLEERSAGKELLLPNSARLYVHFENSQPIVFLDSHPLAPMIEQADSKPERKRSGWLTTVLVLYLILAIWGTVFSILQCFGVPLIGTALIKISYPLLVASVFSGSIEVLAISLLLMWKKWGFYLVAGNALVGAILEFVFLHTGSILTFIPFIAVIVLYGWLNRSNVWDKMS